MGSAGAQATPSAVCTNESSVSVTPELLGHLGADCKSELKIFKRRNGIHAFDKAISPDLTQQVYCN